jgi:hypothetical protein
MSSPVPVKLGVPIKIASYDIPDKTSSENDDDDHGSETGSSYSSASDADDDLTSSDELDEFPVTVFASSPRQARKLQKVPARMPKLGSSLSNLHNYMLLAAPQPTTPSSSSIKPQPLSFAHNPLDEAEDEDEEDDEEVTPPQRIPNPVPRNSPFWDRNNINGAELGLLSIAIHAPFGEDEDRAVRRLRVLGVPMPPPPNSPHVPRSPGEEPKSQTLPPISALPQNLSPVVAAASSPRAIPTAQSITEAAIKVMSISPSTSTVLDSSSPSDSMASGPLKDSPSD